MSKNKHEEYALAIIAKISELFNDEDSDRRVDVEELKDSHNMTEFAHALFNLAPTAILNELTGKDRTILDRNYMANRLCFQNASKK